MSLSKRIVAEIAAALEGAEVEVMSEDDVHFFVTVHFSGFKGLTLIAQHKMVYDGLSSDLKEKVHALSLHTSDRQGASQ